MFVTHCCSTYPLDENLCHVLAHCYKSNVRNMVQCDPQFFSWSYRRDKRLPQFVNSGIMPSASPQYVVKFTSLVSCPASVHLNMKVHLILTLGPICTSQDELSALGIWLNFPVPPSWNGIVWAPSFVGSLQCYQYPVSVLMSSFIFQWLSEAKLI